FVTLAAAHVGERQDRNGRNPFGGPGFGGVFEGQPQVGRGLEPPRRVFVQAARDDAFERLGHVRRDLAQRPRLLAQDGGERREQRIAAERPLPTERLVEN